MLVHQFLLAPIHRKVLILESKTYLKGNFSAHKNWPKWSETKREQQQHRELWWQFWPLGGVQQGRVRKRQQKTQTMKRHRRKKRWGRGNPTNELSISLKGLNPKFRVFQRDFFIEFARKCPPLPPPSADAVPTLPADHSDWTLLEWSVSFAALALLFRLLQILLLSLYGQIWSDTHFTPFLFNSKSLISDFASLRLP